MDAICAFDLWLVYRMPAARNLDASSLRRTDHVPCPSARNPGAKTFATDPLARPANRAIISYDQSGFVFCVVHRLLQAD
jgi:hypothetical protein